MNMSPFANQACRRIRHRSGSGGFTLLEALVSLLVLAIGLLGLAALQARGMRYNHDALVRSDANILATDIIDRMRARSFGNDATTAFNALTGYTAAVVMPPAELANPTQPCAVALLNDPTIGNELVCWFKEVQLRLPGGTAVINNADGEHYTVTLTWANRNDSNNPNATTSQTWSFLP